MKNKLTWKELECFIKTLSEEEKNNNVPVSISDEERGMYLYRTEKTLNDVWMYDNDPENIHDSKEELMNENKGGNPNLCKLVIPKGTPFINIDY